MLSYPNFPISSFISYAKLLFEKNVIVTGHPVTIT
jgi:hypothetical protein